MKLFKSMILCSVGALITLFSGCSDWLDVNVDPENPTAGNATYDSRLAHIEFYTTSATQFAAWRSVCLWAIGHAIMTAALIGACLIGVLRPVPLPLPTNGGSVELL